MTMTFLDRQVTSAYQEAQKATQIPQEYQRLTALMECAAAGNEHCLKLYTMRLFRVCTRLLTAFFITERMRKKLLKKFF